MKKVIVRDLPDCNFCGAPAKYDAPTRTGQWAYMCPVCFKLHASSNAVDIGSELVEKVITNKQLQTKKPTKIKTVMVPLTWDSVVYIECPYCGYERAVEPDANYTVTCEGCGNKYNVRSMI